MRYSTSMDRGDRGRGGGGRGDSRAPRGRAPYSFKSGNDNRGGFRGGSRGGGGFRGRGGFGDCGGGRGRGRGGFGDCGNGRFRGRGGFGGCGGGRFRGRGGFGGRGGGRGRGGRGPRGGGKITIVEPHRHEGVFIGRGAQDELLTKNSVPRLKVYNEKLVVVENDEGREVEYRTWNPFRSKLAAAIMGGIENIYMKSGSKVLYLGAASGTTVSHVADIVGPEGLVYAVEFSNRSGRDLVSVAQKRLNVVPIIEDARHPEKYRMLVEIVDVIFSDVAQPDQALILALNAHHYLKNEGHIILSIKANCIDSTVPPEVVVAKEIEKLRGEKMKLFESLTLEPYERDHTIVCGIYRPKPKEEKNVEE